MANPIDYYIIIGVYIGVVLFIGFILYQKFGKKKTQIQDFKEQPLKKTYHDALKQKIDIFGVKFNKFKLLRDFQIVGYPEKYMIVDIELPKYRINPKSKEIEVIEKEKPVKSRLMIIRSLNKNWLLRQLKLKKFFFLFELTDNFNNLLHIEAEKKQITIQGKIDLDTFGNIWIMSETGIEYLSNISIKRLLEQNISHTENMPDRVVHYDIQQAKLERRDRLITELEKSKYEERKNVGDSTIV